MKKRSLPISCGLLEELRIKSKSLDLTEAGMNKRKNKSKAEQGKLG